MNGNNEEEKITKPVCALEVLKKLKLIQILSVVGIASIFLAVFLDNIWLSGGLSVVVFGFFLFDSKKKESELKQKYGI